VWKARISAVLSGAGTLMGYAISWRDETDLHRAEAVFQRLRSQAEDLPVPIMYPDPKIEKWFGNAACEHALQRLAPYLPFPVNPLDGVPIQLFLPDESARRALFRDPARLPYKAQLKMGPETIAILVSPIRDEEQRYLGPQITWEIVHFTRKEAPAAPTPRVSRPVGAPPPAVPRTAAAAAVVPVPMHPADAAPSPVKALRGEARALESAAADLQTLVRLLDLVADQAEGQGSEVVAFEASAPDSGVTGQAEAAIAAALVAVRRAAAEATGALSEEARSFTAELQDRVRGTMQRTQHSAEALGRIMTAASGLTELRQALGEPAAEVSAGRAARESFGG
jgi:methyl-accepting chemotaxis protein